MLAINYVPRYILINFLFICLLASVEGPRPLRARKVSCLQTIHIRENYDHWVDILKREQQEKERQDAEKREKEAEENDAQTQEDEMETIEEEGAVQRLSPTVSHLE